MSNNNNEQSSPLSNEHIRKIQFSPKLEKAIQNVLPSNDVFDSPYFDPVDYLNEVFPNEQAINENLEDFSSRVKRQIHLVDEEILTTIRRQSNSGTRAKKDLEDSKDMIHVSIFLVITLLCLVLTCST
jgi:hypothetical protein